jgi:hypothetical protein
MTTFFALFLFLGAFLWLGLTATVFTLNDSDAAGNGLSQAYGIVIALALWVILAIVLVMAGFKGGMRRTATAWAMLLHPASGAATIAAILLLSDRTAARWPIVVPVLLPPLLATYSIWAYFPALREKIPARKIGLIIGVAVLILSLLPWPMMVL